MAKLTGLGSWLVLVAGVMALQPACGGDDDDHTSGGAGAGAEGGETSGGGAATVGGGSTSSGGGNAGDGATLGGSKAVGGGASVAGAGGDPGGGGGDSAAGGHAGHEAGVAGAAGEPGGQAGAPGLDPPACSGELPIEDEYSLVFLRLSLGIETGPITGEDAAQLTQLRTQFGQNMNGLECMNNLVALDLQDSAADGAEPLKALTKLKSLVLMDTSLRLEPLAEMTQLEALDLSSTWGNYPWPLSAIAPLVNLKSLNLSGYGEAGGPQQVEGAPLQSFEKLEWLDVSRCSLDDFSQFNAFAKLRELHAADNDFVAVTFPAALPALEDLDLARNPLSELSWLAQLPNLRHLDLAGTAINDADVGAMAGLSELIELDVSLTGISDLSPFLELPSLKLLRAVGPSINCTNQADEIAALVAAGVRVHSDCGAGGPAGPVEGVVGRTPYDCSGSLAFRDWNVFEAVREKVGYNGRPLDPSDVESLTELAPGAVEMLAGIECLPALKTLSMTGLYELPLEPLQAIPSLENVSIYWDSEGNNDPRPELHWPLTLLNLKQLLVAGNEQTDLSTYEATGVFESMTQLESFTFGAYHVFPPRLPSSLLELQLSGIYSTPFVEGVPNLVRLDLSGNALDCLCGLADLAQLEYLDIADQYGNDSGTDICVSEAATIALLRQQGTVVVGCP